MALSFCTDLQNRLSELLQTLPEFALQPKLESEKSVHLFQLLEPYVGIQALIAKARRMEREEG